MTINKRTGCGEIQSGGSPFQACKMHLVDWGLGQIDILFGMLPEEGIFFRKFTP